MVVGKVREVGVNIGEAKAEGAMICFSLGM